jgi:hypothetical protein
VCDNSYIGSYPCHCAGKSSNSICNETGFQDFRASKCLSVSLQMQLPAILSKSWVLCLENEVQLRDCISVLDVTVFVGSSCC